jgi:small-conductance mechanosensitive channel
MEKSMLNYVIWGNSLTSWLLAISTFIFSYILLKLLINIFIKNLEKRKLKKGKPSDSLVLTFLTQTKTFFVIVLSLYLASIWLTLQEKPALNLRTIFMILLWVQVGIWVNYLLVEFINLRNNKDTSGDDKTTLNALKTVLRIVLWSIIFILVVDNIPGVQITALITSLGIGGIAIGLALQNVLGDLFASLSISLDKPFVINDLIQVDSFMGTVEKIGLKSTRLRSISGEQLIFSNSDLLNSRIQNFKRLERRRNLLKLGVLYQTTPDQLRKIPELIRSIFSELEELKLDRVHLSDFGDFSINFEIVYWVESSDFLLHMDQKQNILLRIFDDFIKNGIEFAYPTQSIFIENNGESPLLD